MTLKLGLMEEAGTNLGLSPRDPFPWASPPTQPAFLARVSPLLSGPLFPATSQPFPRLGGGAPRPSLPRWRVSLCLTGSQLRRALRLLLTSAQLLQEEEGRAARERIPDSRFGVCLQHPGNSALALPPLSNYSSAPPSQEPSFCSPFLSGRVGPGYLATPSFPHLELPSTQLSFSFLLLPPVHSLCSPRSSCGGGEWRWEHPGAASTVSLHHSPVSCGLQQAKKRVNHYFPNNTQPPLDSLTQALRRRGQLARCRPALPS